MNNVIKKALLITAGLAVCAVSSLALVNFSSHETVSLAGNEDNISLLLNSSNAPANFDEYGDFSQTFGDFTTLDYKQAKTSAGNHVALKSGGSIEKREASKSLISVNIVCEGTIRFESSYEKSDFEGGSYMSFVVTSNSVANVWGNYWRVIAEEDSVITSIDLVYGCRTSSSPTSNNVSISSFDSVNNYFVSWEIINEEFYLVFYANVDTPFANSLLRPNELLLQDRFGCSFIQYRSAQRIKAYFNLSKYFEEQGTNVSYEALQHLKVRGVFCAAYNASGDLRHKDKRVNQTTFNAERFTLGIYETTWGSGTGYMAGIRYTPNFGIASKPASSIVNQTSVNFVNNDTVRVRLITESNSVKKLEASTFVLKNGSTEVQASSVTVGDDYDGYGYLLDINFPIDTIYSLWNGSSNYDFWCHLYINGKTYDGSNNGDLKTNESIGYTSSSPSYVKWSRIYQNGEDTNANMNVFKAYEMIIIRISKRGS